MWMKLWRRFAVLLVMICIGGAAAAQNARAWSRVDQVGEKQDITTTVIQYPAGNARIISRFSNGRRIDGDNFVSDVQIHLQDGNIMLVRLGEAVNATFGGSTEVRFKETALELPAASIQTVKVAHYTVDTKPEYGLVYQCKGEVEGESSCSFELLTGEVNPTVPAPFREAPRIADVSPCAGYPTFHRGGLEFGIMTSCDPNTGTLSPKRFDMDPPPGMNRL